MSAFAASLVLAAAAIAGPTANPSVVIPDAETTSVLRIREAGMYRIAVTTDVDVDCQLSDALRGDFLSRNERCAFDALLDPGVYKLALSFGGNGKSQTGRAKVDVTALVEDEVSPVRMDDGASIEAILLEGHQRSFWLDVPTRKHIAFTVAGRTAGRIELWRNDKWIETGRLDHRSLALGSGRQVHLWEFARVIEPGQYKVVVYGTQPKKWAKAETRTRQNRLKVAAAEDALFISRGPPPSDPRGLFEFEIPAWGFARFAVPFKRTASSLALSEAPKSEVVLTALSVRTASPRFSGGNRCSVYKSNSIPTCGVRMTSGGDLTVLEVRGPPGTRGVIRAAQGKTRTLTDGRATSMNTKLDFSAPRLRGNASADYFVGTFNLPADDDAAPLSCALEELDARGRAVSLVATDEPSLSSAVALSRSFNYNQRTGAGIWFSVTDADTFAIATNGRLSSQCELFGIAPNGRSTRLASGEKPKKKKASARTNHCEISKFLSPGRYLLRLYNGRPGVEKIRIGTRNAKQTTSGSSSCQIPSVKIESGRRYRLSHSRTGRAQSRGLILRPLPLDTKAPLSASITKDRPLEIPIRDAGRVRIRSLSAAAFECGPATGPRTTSRNGVCTTTIRANARLKVSTKNAGTLPLFIEDAAKASVRRLKGPTSFRPKATPALARLSADKEVFFDFDRNQERAFALDVPRAGLYELESTGLLAMQCSVRTPTVQRVYDDKSGGRGRNCLLQGGLRPGQYLLKVRSVGKSRGRAGLVLRQRKPVRAPELKIGAVRHQDITAGSLVVTPVHVEAENAGQLLHFTAAAAGGRTGSCRLEDDDGWPVKSAPHSCVFDRNLSPGHYRWIQLPEAVDTTRRISVLAGKVEKVLQPAVGAVTPLTLGALVAVNLGDQKEQQFRLDLPAELEVLFSLDNGMRGALYSLGSNGKPADKIADVGPMTARGQLPNPPFSAGVIQRQKLKAGAYLLKVRHSRDDVGISYRVGAAVRTLAPGVSFDVGATDTVAVKVPEDGYVRIRTEGMVDVRCRLFDNRDRLVAESNAVGADWNCGLVRRLDAGSYRLVLESEAGGTGQVRVSLSRPKTKALGTLRSGTRLKTGDQTQTIFLAPTRGDVVEDVLLTSDAPLSCSLEASDGEVLATSIDQMQCRLLAWPGPRSDRGERDGLVVRVWQTAKSGGIRYQRTTRTVRAFTGGTLSPKSAGLSIIEDSGLFETGEDVVCRSASERGALQDCSQQAPLAKGPVVIAGLSKAPTAIALRERIRPAGTSVSNVPLSIRPFFERHQSDAPQLHLATVQAPAGVDAPPVCSLVGGLSRIDIDRCVSAVARQVRSTLFTFAAEDTPYVANILRRSVAIPKASPLPRGVASLGWKGDATAFLLPKASYRMEVYLAPQTWAVALDSRDRVGDVCSAPPSAVIRETKLAALTPCRLRGKGGTLVLVSAPGAAAGRARVQLVTLPGAAKASLPLRPMQEVVPGAPGAQAFTIERSKERREVHIDSHGTFVCDLIREDGVQQRGCHLTLPSGLSAKFLVDHDGSPFRARVHRTGWAQVARFGQRMPKRLGAPLPAGDAVSLSANGLTDRTISVDKRSVIRVKSDSGVCALFSGRRTLAVDGLGGPCDLSYIADPGSLRVMVRPFGNLPNFGDVYIVKDEILRIGEGVGPTTWVGPGEERFFRFDVKSDAHVGIGLQRQSDAVLCTLYDRSHRAITSGCQQYNFLKRGGYELGIKIREGDPPLAVRPVVLGNQGTDADVPEDVLNALRAQAGGTP